MEEMENNLNSALVLIWVIILLCGIMVFVIGWCAYQNNEACKDLGFVGVGNSKGGVSVCEDIKGNLYYVKFEGFWDMKAKTITVGDNRIVTSSHQ